MNPSSNIGRWVAVVITPLLLAAAVAVVPAVNSALSLELDPLQVTVWTSALALGVAGAAIQWLRNRIRFELLAPSAQAISTAGRIMLYLSPAITALSVGLAAKVREWTGAEIDSVELAVLLGSVALGSIAVIVQWISNRGQWEQAALEAVVPEGPEDPVTGLTPEEIDDAEDFEDDSPPPVPADVVGPGARRPSRRA